MQTLYTSITFSFLRKIEQASLENDKELVIGLGLEPEHADRIAAFRAADVFKLSRIYKIVNIDIDEQLLLMAVDKANEGSFIEENIQDAELTGELLRMLSLQSMEVSNQKYLIDEFDISESAIEVIRNLTLFDISKVVKTGIHFYSITADEHKLPMALDFIESHYREEESINKLIEADASFPMVHALTGMQKKAFQIVRKQKGLLQSTGTGGAPKRLDQEQAHIAYEAWCNSEGKPLIERCLAVHKAVDIGLRHLWPRIEEFRRYEQGEEVTLA